MITFSLVSGGTSVAALFMAGYIPGILWGLACMIVIYIFAMKKGYKSTSSFKGKEKLMVIWQALPSLLMIVIVIGGIIGGIFTATEGSVVAVVYTLILSLFFYKTIKFKDLPRFSGKCGDDRYHRVPDRRIQHHVLGHGIYRYPDSGIQCVTGNQQ